MKTFLKNIWSSLFTAKVTPLFDNDSLEIEKFINENEGQYKNLYSFSYVYDLAACAELIKKMESIKGKAKVLSLSGYDRALCLGVFKEITEQQLLELLEISFFNEDFCVVAAEFIGEKKAMNFLKKADYEYNLTSAFAPLFIKKEQMETEFYELVANVKNENFTLAMRHYYYL